MPGQRYNLPQEQINLPPACIQQRLLPPIPVMVKDSHIYENVQANDPALDLNIGMMPNQFGGDIDYNEMTYNGYMGEPTMY